MAQETVTPPEEAPKRSLVSTDYRTISYVTGPLVFVNNVHEVAYNEMVAIRMPDGVSVAAGRSSRYRVTSLSSRSSRERRASTSMRQRFASSRRSRKIAVSPELLGRVLNGVGEPIDGGAPDHP